MRCIPLLVFGILAACSDDPGKGQADVDYAAINEAAEGPGAAIAPDPMTWQFIADNNLGGAGCAVLQKERGDALFIAGLANAHFSLNGELRTFAPHPRNDPRPSGIAAHYDGRAHSAEVIIDLESQRIVSDAISEYSGKLMIRDAKERLVFQHSGYIRCSE